MSDLSTTKFRIGDTVCNKKIYLPVAGKIVGYILGYAFEKIASGANIPIDHLDRLYPDWKDKYIYYIFLETPIDSYKDYEHIFNLLGVESPKFHVISLPEDDLELL